MDFVDGSSCVTRTSESSSFNVASVSRLAVEFQNSSAAGRSITRRARRLVSVDQQGTRRSHTPVAGAFAVLFLISRTFIGSLSMSFRWPWRHVLMRIMVWPFPSLSNFLSILIKNGEQPHKTGIVSWFVGRYLMVRSELRAIAPLLYAHHPLLKLFRPYVRWNSRWALEHV